MSAIAVVGGGISGMTAAWRLVGAGHDVVLFEGANRLGGKIRTSELAGVPVDEGPDSLLARVPAGVALCRELGLGEELVAPAAGDAHLWVGGRLRPIPSGLALGVPVEFGPLARSGLLSRGALLRARLEPLLPGAPLRGDVAVGRLVRRRYGRRLHEVLVDPLLGGINAGRSDELSIEVGAAPLAAAARRHRSLTTALRAIRREHPPDPKAPVFYAPRGGLQRLVDALECALRDAGVVVRTGAAVTALERDGGAWRLLAGDVEHAVDGVVVALPAWAAAPLLAGSHPQESEVLGAIEHASVAIVSLVYPAAAVREPLPGSGFLVPRTEGRLLTAGSVYSSKWPTSAPAGAVVVRASVGRAGQEAALALDDATLAERVDSELSEAMGLSEAPVAVRVSRWPRSFPQFRPGHLERMAAVSASLAPSRVALVGAALAGVGIPTCIAGAADAVAGLEATL